MKATGVVRKLDALGRTSVPKDVRRRLDIKPKDALEFLLHNDQIVLRKYEPNQKCVITGEISDKNMQLTNSDLVVSPEGAKQLLNELQDYIQQQDDK